ncbi:MAG: hypothetical protein M1831_002511 [Alyxoria varia]|nr:MAG: hypothetical protein M1831_002511 [Alyxoria varia]
MSTELLRPPVHLTPAEALRLSQQAPAVLEKHASWSLPWPLSLVFTSDSPEKWAIYENLILSCLRTGDDKSAQECLDKLKARFGEGNQRVMGLVGLYHEAIANDNKELKVVLKSYEEAIAENPTNMIIRKRHIALLKSVGEVAGATAALVDLLDVVPVDAEAWTEISDLYFQQGLYTQAAFSLEEALLITPNAWNIHAKLGEVIYTSTLALSNNDDSKRKGFARSIKSFCRSVELCDDYLRSNYGLKLATSKLIHLLPSSGASLDVRKNADDNELPIPPLKTVQKLNELATSKLAEIVRRYSTKDENWSGYEEAEIIASRELLNRDVEKTIR